MAIASIVYGFFPLFLLTGKAFASPPYACNGWGTEGFPYTATRVEQCLNAGGDPNAMGGMTALMYAAQDGDQEAIWLLLAHGANPNIQNPRGLTALMLAAIAGHTKTIESLVTYGADVNMQDRQGQTALFFASVAGGHAQVTDHARALIFADIVTYLLRNGADVNAHDKNGWTALIAATAQGDQNIILRLVPGADVNSQTTRGMTALTAGL